MSFHNNLKTEMKSTNKHGNPFLDTVLKDSSNKKRKTQISSNKHKYFEQKESYVPSKGKNKTLAVK